MPVESTGQIELSLRNEGPAVIEEPTGELEIQGSTDMLIVDALILQARQGERATIATA
jgi:hypothetical protein